MRHAVTSPELGITTSWFKRIGFVGFVFFLGKGLLWLAVLAAGWFLR